jgi:hypothetical protein
MGNASPMDRQFLSYYGNFFKAFCHSADFLVTGGQFIPPQRQKIGELLWQL